MQVVMLHKVTHTGAYIHKFKIGLPENLAIIMGLKACFPHLG
jgi:hypothetical protein